MECLGAVAAVGLSLILPAPMVLAQPADPADTPGSPGGSQINDGAGPKPGSRVSRPLNAMPAPAPETHLFGDWGGLRTSLDHAGIRLSLDYKTESAWNAAGGRRQGADYAHQFALQETTDWGKLAGIAGLQTYVVLINRAGRNASADYVGDTVTQAQEIYGGAFDQAVNLVALYAEESLLGDRINFAAGRFTPGTDFVASPLYCDFMVLTTCGHPQVLTSNQGFEVWPRNEWGGLIRVRPAAEMYFMVGVFQSQPFPTGRQRYTQGGYSGFDWTLRGTTGVSVPLEVAYEPVFGSTQLTGHYKAGLNWDTSRYSDTAFGVTGRPLAANALRSATERGRLQLWATFDQMLLRTGGHQDDGLILVGAFGHNDPRTSLIKDFVSIGLVHDGFWPARPGDRIGFNYTYYDVSRLLTRTEELQSSLGLPLGMGARGIQKNAQVLEANYGLPIRPGVQLQPEVEYFVHPGAARTVRDALVVGLKTHVSF